MIIIDAGENRDGAKKEKEEDWLRLAWSSSSSSNSSCSMMHLHNMGYIRIKTTGSRNKLIQPRSGRVDVIWVFRVVQFQYPNTNLSF